MSGFNPSDVLTKTDWLLQPGCNPNELAFPVFMALITNCGLRHTRTHSVYSDVSMDALLVSLAERGWEELLSISRHVKPRADVVVHHPELGACGKVLTNSGNYYHLNAAGPSTEIAAKALDSLLECLPEAQAKSDDEIRMSFWHWSGTRGATSTIRPIDCPKWGSADLDLNYVGKTGTPGACPPLQDLMSLERPEGRGRLLLFHGEPGTGKTYGIRALIRKWAPWCKAHYVMDPESLFGHMDYMADVLLDSGHNFRVPGNVDGDDEEDDTWRLVILEDADEFLVRDAKMEVGQKLSRLLNVADGLLGQGMRLLILITTNEPVGQMHKAVIREGRCLANLEFKKLGLDSSIAWLQTHGHESPVPGGSRSLASLYAMLRERPAGLRAVG